MIYVDPTELRDNTKLPAALVGEATSLPGLEAMTGADILITPHDDFMLTELKDILPHRKSLQYHCNNGILIQRKSGGDFLSSIDNLTEIEWRMQEWSDNPWLLVTEIKRGKGGKVIAGGKYFRKWNFSSVSGALDAWQDRGGSVKQLDSDQDIYWWIKGRERRCITWLKEPEKKVSKGGHKGKTSRQSLHRIQDTWCSTKWAFPAGIGRVMMESLARYIVSEWERPPTFANAIALACSDEVLKIDGWGKISLNNVREWYGVTNSISPVSTGAESGCWIYNLPARRPVGRKVFVVGDKIIDGDTVFEIVTEPVGELGDVIDLTDCIMVKDRKWK